LFYTGTYTRTAALDILIDEFLAQPIEGPPQTKQIISLGAGTDTRYFRLRSQNKHQSLIYHEFDFPSVCETKRQIILNNHIFAGSEDDSLFPSVSGSIPSWQGKEGEWGFERLRDGKAETVYCCHPLDLRNLHSILEIPHGLRMDVPTLLISECCLCYLSVNDSRDVVKWFIVRIPSLGIVLYEPIGIDDSFGQMMVANLAARNITMPSLKSFKTLDDQKSRLSELGFRDANSGQDAETVENIWDYWVPAAEKQRVDDLEGLDEVEEWQMLARHYAIVWGWRGTTGWEGWTTVRENR
jgi:[phosphatase 2A protein]-leucine-carboxy methyltransferase